MLNLFHIRNVDMKIQATVHICRLQIVEWIKFFTKTEFAKIFILMCNMMYWIYKDIFHLLLRKKFGWIVNKLAFFSVIWWRQKYFNLFLHSYAKRSFENEMKDIFSQRVKYGAVAMHLVCHMSSYYFAKSRLAVVCQCLHTIFGILDGMCSTFAISLYISLFLYLGQQQLSMQWNFRFNKCEWTNYGPQRFHIVVHNGSFHFASAMKPISMRLALTCNTNGTSTLLFDVHLTIIICIYWMASWLCFCV